VHGELDALPAARSNAAAVGGAGAGGDGAKSAGKASTTLLAMKFMQRSTQASDSYMTDVEGGCVSVSSRCASAKYARTVRRLLRCWRRSVAMTCPMACRTHR
jgi:hypothetical protein